MKKYMRRKLQEIKAKLLIRKLSLNDIVEAV